MHPSFFRFLDKDLAEYLRLKSSFQNSDKAHEEACAKLARVSKKHRSEKVLILTIKRLCLQCTEIEVWWSLNVDWLLHV